MRPSALRLDVPFEPFRGLRNPHAQTIVAGLLPPGRDVGDRMPLRVRLADADLVTLRVACPSRAEANTPTLVLYHGLEGSARSPYMIRTARKALRLGFRVARLNFRGCGPEPGLARHPYHSGRSGDVRQVLAHLRDRWPGSPLGLIGFSLGGNVVLKLAGETPVEGLRCVAAVSPPINLARCVRALLEPKNRIYHRRFMRSLLARVRSERRYFPSLPPTRFPPDPTMIDFDEAYTAPRSGFRSAVDYYARASSKPVLAAATVPVLIVAARDDPLIPYEVFEGLPGNIRLLSPRHGGHTAFLGRYVPGDLDRFWAENRVLAFVSEALFRGQ